ncbi:AAA family ATPase [Zoogloea sp.]|uniref:AAA family ATPase n=1 Tax=Zoogloea sp. TaxID=49181 RepID=UPI00262A7BEC|nr:AAA family ATPase [Zoogloea sp.]
MTTTAPTWPAHYTPADIDQIGIIKAWISQHAYSQAALARLARISPSSLNQIIKGSYATSPAPLLKAIESAMRHADETSADAVSIVETSVSRLAVTACTMARRYRNFAVLSAYVGTGKTYSLKHYARSTPNTHLLEADPTMTPQTLVKKLARLVGVTEASSVADKFEAVVEQLTDTDSLIIIDEAETLTPHQLHIVRRLRDKAGIGIVLAGTEHLTGILKPLHGQFDQIRSRTGFWPATVQAISADDAAALVQSAFGAEEVADDVVARLYAYSKGSARMLVEGLIAAIKQFRRDRVLDVKLVDAVARQALCLQSLA